jgi:hypothetical protein
MAGTIKSLNRIKQAIEYNYYITCNGVKIDSHDNFATTLSRAKSLFKTFARKAGCEYHIVGERKEQTFYEIV